MEEGGKGGMGEGCFLCYLQQKPQDFYTKWEMSIKIGLFSLLSPLDFSHFFCLLLLLSDSFFEAILKCS